jgi:hypothetical protein
MSYDGTTFEVESAGRDGRAYAILSRFKCSTQSLRGDVDSRSSSRRADGCRSACDAPRRVSMSVPRVTPAPKLSPAGSDWNKGHLCASSMETPPRDPGRRPLSPNVANRNLASSDWKMRNVNRNLGFSDWNLGFCDENFTVPNKKKQNSDRNLSFSDWKKQKDNRNLRFSYQEMPFSDWNFTFSNRKKQNPNENLSFSNQKM